MLCSIDLFSFTLLLINFHLFFAQHFLAGNMRPEFIAERREALQNYINIILMNPILASSLPAKKFVDPETYNQSFHEIAVQNAALCLRTEGLYTLGQSLGAIGWRLRKHYFKAIQKAQSAGKSGSSSSSCSGTTSNHSGKHMLTKSTSQAHSKLLSSAGASLSLENQPKSLEDVEFLTLAWCEYGPDKYIDDKEIHSLLKTLATISHPFIMPIEFVTTNDNGALFVRNFYGRGSLKDLLCGSSPKNPFLSKYGNPKGRGPMPIRDIAIYGRQILEALRFLHSKGMPFGMFVVFVALHQLCYCFIVICLFVFIFAGHIHAGNVIIVDGVARLVDIENFVLGVPSFYRPFFVQHSKISTSELIDVYSFGHLLYELSCGYPLQESITRHPIECPSEKLSN